MKAEEKKTSSRASRPSVRLEAKRKTSAPAKSQSQQQQQQQPSSSSSSQPGARLRINQPAGQEIKSILKNRSVAQPEHQHSLEFHHDDAEDRDERRLSMENLPSVKSKIETYLQQAESAAATEKK